MKTSCEGLARGLLRLELHRQRGLHLLPEEDDAAADDQQAGHGDQRTHTDAPPRHCNDLKIVITCAALLINHLRRVDKRYSILARAMKRLAHYSQYFLRNPRFIKELIGHTSIKKQDIVLDIGAGSGVISSALAGRCRQVMAIEYEPRMAEKLRLNMRHYPNVRVIEDDFLTMPLPDVPYKVFANIPFHLSSKIVRKLTEADVAPQAVYLIVQKQFARKLLPDADHFTGQLGMIIGPLFEAKIKRPLRRTDFWPHPNVDTVLLELKPRGEALVAKEKMPAYRLFIEDCFADPKVFLKMPRVNLGLSGDVKPSQMKLHQWVALFEKQKLYK